MLFDYNKLKSNALFKRNGWMNDWMRMNQHWNQRMDERNGWIVAFENCFHTIMMRNWCVEYCLENLIKSYCYWSDSHSDVCDDYLTVCLEKLFTNIEKSLSFQGETLIERQQQFLRRDMPPVNHPFLPRETPDGMRIRFPMNDSCFFCQITSLSDSKSGETTDQPLVAPFKWWIS